MSDPHFWDWAADHTTMLVLFALVMVEALFVWAYEGDRRPARWEPTHALADLTDEPEHPS